MNPIPRLQNVLNKLRVSKFKLMVNRGKLLVLLAVFSWLISFVRSKNRLILDTYVLNYDIITDLESIIFVPSFFMIAASMRA